MTRKWIGVVLAITLSVSHVGGAYVKEIPLTLYEDQKGQYIGKGIYYEEKSRLTDQGWLNMNVLRVDMKEKTVDLELLGSRFAGDKEPVSELVNEQNKPGGKDPKTGTVVAGINGDFFATNKFLTVALGPTIIDGQLKNAYDQDHRVEKKDQYIFVQDQDGKIRFEMPVIQFGFMNSTGQWMEITSMNKMSSIYTPTYFDRNAIYTSSRMDELNKALMKIVVENDTITQIEKKGGLVVVPENGYIITMDVSQMKNINKFKVGDKVQFIKDMSIDVENIKLGMAGGGKILEEGQAKENPGLIVGASARHPRTVVGFNQSKNELIMVTIDGRGESMGATLAETTEIMKELGAWEAVMLDGGGSTTMVTRPTGELETKIANDPSGFYERPVINGLGVRSSAKVSNKPRRLMIKSSLDRLFINNYVTFTLSAVDTNYNPVKVDMSKVRFKVNGVSGFWKENSFYPTSKGKATITAYYEGVTEKYEIAVMEPASLVTSKEQITLNKGEKKEIKINGKSLDGFTAPIDTMSMVWTVTGNIGTMSKGVFTAGDQEGQGILTGRLGETTVSMVISIGGREELLYDFDSFKPKVEPVVYPDVVGAEVGYTGGASGEGLELKYSYIGQTKANQGAYLTFDETPLETDSEEPVSLGIPIKGEPLKLGLDVMGDGSGKWLRGKIVDSKMKTYSIDFAKKVDWSGWEKVEAVIPENVTYPIYLKRIYMVSLEQEEPLVSAIKVDNLTARYANKLEDVAFTEKGAIKDYQQVQTEFLLTKKGSKIALFGSTAGKNNELDHVVQRQVVKQMNDMADVALFAGKTEIKDAELQIPNIQWKDQYEVVDYGDLRLIQLGTGKGSLVKTDPMQWKYLQQHLKETKVDNILITLNKDPRTGFSDQKEGQLLHKLLSDYATSTGKNVYVVNASGYKTDNELFEGVHYITTNGLWFKDQGENLDLQKTFYMVLFNVGKDGLTYSIKPIYNNEKK